jgi:general secretion pathway protein I
MKMAKLELLKVKNSIKGFTLLEVLVALVIVSLVFFACSLSLSQMTKNVQFLEEKTIASIVASNVVTNARLGMLVVPKTGQVKEKTLMAKKIWYWSLEKVNTDQNKVTEIAVTVKNGNGKLIYNTKGFLSENQ